MFVKINPLRLILCIASQMLIINLTGQSIFPNAEGYGTNSRGAYGGSQLPEILIVDNIETGNFSTGQNRGTFEWCITQSYPRIIIFEVGGIIDYRGKNKGTLRIRDPYINIYGQTSPDPGITIIGTDLIIDTHDVLIQHIAVRYGDDMEIIHNRDALSIYQGYNIVVDHCSFSWGNDENIGISDGVNNITISNCIVAEPLVYSWDVDPSGLHEPRRCGHSFGLTADENISIFKNYIVYGYDRNPPINVESAVFFNNFIYKSGPDHGLYVRSTESNSKISIVSNVVLPTGKWLLDPKADYFGSIHSSTNLSTSVYLNDNICQGNLNNVSKQQWENMYDYAGLTPATSSPVDLSEFTILPYGLVENYLISNAGARFWDRSYHDSRIVKSVSERQGHEIDSPEPLQARAYNKSIYEGLKTSDGSMENGYDWSSSPRSITINGKTISLNSSFNNISDLLNYLNSQMPDGTEAIKHPHPECFHIIFQSIERSDDAAITVSGNGLAIFGIEAGTYYGSDGVGGWPNYDETKQPLNIPDNLHNDSDGDGYTNIEEWAYLLGNGETQAENNNPPIIQNQEISIVDTIQAGTIIGIVKAFDPDQEQSITYSIINGNPDNLYSINAATGELTITNTLVQNTARTDNLSIQVEDNAAMKLSNTAIITIKIIAESMVIYIDPSNENDNLEDGSFDHPFNSWTDIEWKEGYSYLQKRGTIASEEKINLGSGNITLGAYGEGDLPKIKSTATDFAIRVYEKTNILIENLTISAPDAISCIYILGSSCDSNTVLNCVLEESINGIRIIDGKKVVCKYNTFKNKGDGIYSYAQETEVYYNIFTGNLAAINITSNLSEANICNNVFYNNREAITTSYAALTLYNNIFYLVDRGDMAITHKMDRIISDYNIFYPEQEGFISISYNAYSDINSYRNALGIDMHSFSEDPMFIDIFNDNFNVMPQSPAIDAGTFVGLFEDYSGKNVPDGNAPDIGLFETFKADNDIISDIDDSLVEPIIFPNPSNGHFNIKLNNNQMIYSHLNIQDLSGRQIHQIPISENNNDISVDISDFPNGLYVLYFSSTTNNLSKIIILK